MPGYSTERKPSGAYKALTDIVTGLVVLVFLALIGLLFASPFMTRAEEAPATLAEPLEVAAEGVTCESLIEAAMQASDDGCQRTGSNEVCYGNNTVNAQLVSDFSGIFAAEGDIVPVDALQTLAASPLDLTNEEWGIAVLKMQALLPQTVPGQNVTFLVVGDTNVDNASGDMQAFYLSTGFGNVACEKVAFDGLTVTTPDGMAIAFNANDTDIVLSGLASLTARSGEGLVISLFRGIGMVTANGVSQIFGAGHSVSIPMNGTSASGSPSTPVALSDAAQSVSCSLYGIGCPGDDIDPISVEDAQALLEAATGIPITGTSSTSSGSGDTTGGTTTGGTTDGGSTDGGTTDGGTTDGGTTDGGSTGGGNSGGGKGKDTDQNPGGGN